MYYYNSFAVNPGYLEVIWRSYVMCFGEPACVDIWQTIIKEKH